MTDNTYNEVKEIIDIISQLYELKSSRIKTKLDNIRRINIDSIVNLIETEENKEDFKSREDIVNYIEAIIQD